MREKRFTSMHSSTRNEVEVTCWIYAPVALPPRKELKILAGWNFGGVPDFI
jgi:hypothetical protein